MMVVVTVVMVERSGATAKFKLIEPEYEKRLNREKSRPFFSSEST